MDVNKHEVLERQAQEAAVRLSEIAEWAPAGQMLRVAAIAKSGDLFSVARAFALNALEDCLLQEGKRLCTFIVELLEEPAATTNFEMVE